MMDEDELIGWLRGRLAASTSRQEELLGDDCAFLPAAGPMAVTVDSQIEGVHFLPGTAPDVIARRLLAVNLSDLAAVGAAPAHAFLALAAPKGFDHQRFFRALIEAAERVDLTLAGGDLAGGDRVHATLTLLGQQVEGGRFVRRRDARPGDRLYLGGPVGVSALGFAARRAAQNDRVDGTLPDLTPGQETAAERAIRRHLEPTPQLELGRWLARRQRAAAIDLSDGLARDLHRLCRESGVGAAVEREALVMEPDLVELAGALGRNPLDLMLAGGEDYVLLFALPPTGEPPAGSQCIGSITEPGAIDLVDRSGARHPLDRRGFDHLSE